MYKISSNNPDCVIVDFVLHNVCNFKCSYCHESANGGNQRWHDDVTPYINFINHLKTNHKNIFIGLLGGEPTMWPYFQDFLQTLNEGSTAVEFNTNGARTLRYWEDFTTNASNTRMILSWHNEEMDDDHFFEVARIMENKADVMVSLLVTPDVFDRAELLFERLKTLNISTTAKRVRHHYNRPEFMEYTTEQKKKIAEWRHPNKRPTQDKWVYPQQVSIDGRYLTRAEYLDLDINTKGWACEAGIKRFVVSPDGTITRCSQVVQSMGNIFGEYTFFTEPKPCPIDKCICFSDVLINKYSPIYWANQKL